MKNCGRDLDVTYIKIKDILASEKYKMSMEEIQDAFAKRDENGLRPSILQIGKRAFIRQHLFDEWYEEMKRSEFSGDKTDENI